MVSNLRITNFILTQCWNSRNGVGNGRGDISLHPKLLDVEGYFRYPQRNGNQ